MPIDALYAEHIERLTAHSEQLLDAQGYDALLVHAGSPGCYFLDDNHRPFRANPHFLAWLPLLSHPHCCLLLRPGRQPRLFYYHAIDFWHQPAGPPQGFWTSHFEIEEFQRPQQLEDALRQVLRHTARVAFIGEDRALAEGWGVKDINPPSLLAALHWQRARKSGYELACLRNANRIAVGGHQAAAECFQQGGTEFEIQMAYLAATEQRESELPYGNIVAVNEHAAVLHYQLYQRSAPTPSRSLLIDAGATRYGYAADITRTYSRQNGLFAELIEALNQAQRALISTLAVGQCFVDLHLDMCLRIGAILEHCGLVDAPPEQQLEQGIVSSFFPHGLGHLLGLQVHDVGGLQADPLGTPAPAPAAHPFLRLTRTLEPGMVFTIEPGLYLIESLLQPLRASAAGKTVDWAMVESLRPFGGIRIEDNIHLGDGGVENLTRNAWAG